MTTSVIGQGTATITQQTSINYEMPSDWGPQYKIVFVGTAYQVTAAPAQGWTFSRWNVTCQQQPGSGTPTAHTHSSQSNPLDSNIYSGKIWAEWADEGYECWLFEGIVTQYFNNIAQSSWTWSDVNAEATFVRSHIPTHLIIRDDATGKIVRGGTDNKILRDD